MYDGRRKGRRSWDCEVIYGSGYEVGGRKVELRSHGESEATDQV